MILDSSPLDERLILKIEAVDSPKHWFLPTKIHGCHTPEIILKQPKKLRTIKYTPSHT